MTYVPMVMFWVTVPSPPKSRGNATLRLVVNICLVKLDGLMDSRIKTQKSSLDPKLVQANDFFFSGLHLAGNTSNVVGSKVTPVTVAQLPGLNTLGISMVRIDYAPWGINPPHTHPRATEILTVLEGSLQVGFVTSNLENHLITKVLQKGDVFVFPVNLIHFQRNVGYGNAVAIAALSSQNPGVITIANAVFGSKPAIPSDLLAKAFQVDENIINWSLSFSLTAGDKNFSWKAFTKASHPFICLKRLFRVTHKFFRIRPEELPLQKGRSCICNNIPSLILSSENAY
ncbi:hypothetical protein HYC85_016735 [Camellia sinensis]|uniref:Germin-like protein n=1 Tax=Camellia sinensis TaxID=4442 RepID=A0A7J7H1P9_CAMSI|nr:hypothetical protein HYC85_016735 [Camellia sinensis]